ncbi:hypothetical protein L210DRAFT_947878 [Boletus edulis BED1]|uniref:Uncharacterized protein n=1 Tax=Boletus edulis BED1 TaxID=1328754 RepID=A0AAD4BTV6_BOLED|nr:hypothetical protein L210DRAFT_947878 [Boletus edulis BED1]
MEICLVRTSEQGSRQLVYAAIGERDSEDHMKSAYVSNAGVAEPSCKRHNYGRLFMMMTFVLDVTFRKYCVHHTLLRHSIEA